MRILLTMIFLLLPISSVAETITIDTVLLRKGSGLSRPAIEIDAVEQALIDGSWLAPEADAPNSDWRPVAADENGWLLDNDLR